MADSFVLEAWTPKTVSTGQTSDTIPHRTLTRLELAGRFQLWEVQSVIFWTVVNHVRYKQLQSGYRSVSWICDAAYFNQRVWCKDGKFFLMTTSLSYTGLYLRWTVFSCIVQSLMLTFAHYSWTIKRNCFSQRTEWSCCSIDECIFSCKIDRRCIKLTKKQDVTKSPVEMRFDLLFQPRVSVYLPPSACFRCVWSRRGSTTTPSSRK